MSRGPERRPVAGTDPGEAEARRALCRVGAQLGRVGLLAGRAGNLSVRLADGGLLVTPAGASTGRMAPDEMIRVEADGPPPPGASSELSTHRAAHRARPEAGAVVHAHPPALTALARRGWSPADLLPEVGEALDGLAVVEPMPSGSRELADAVERALAGGASVLILRGHGSLAVADTLEEARDRTELAELSAYATLLARSEDPPVDPARLEALCREAADAGGM